MILIPTLKVRISHKKFNLSKNNSTLPLQNYSMASSTIKHPLQETIIKAGCDHFEINEKDLLSSTEIHVAEMRFILFYLIKKNTKLSERFIGARFNKSKSPVRYGIDIIDCTKEKYVQTMYHLKKIAEKAGNLEF